MTTDLLLSHSQVDNYQTCGERYRLEKVARVPRVPGWSLVGGSAVHSVTEAADLTSFGVPLEEGQTTDFEEAFYLEIERRKAASPDFPPETWHRAGRASKANPNKEDMKWWLESGPIFVRNYSTWLNSSPWQVYVHDGVPAVELALEGEIGGVRVRGYLDRVMEHMVTGELAIVDVKTGSRDPASNGQLGTYKLLLDATDYPPVKWGFYAMVRSASSTIPAELAPYAAGLHYTYETVVKGVEAGLYLPSRGPLCNSCGVRDYCWAVGGELAEGVAPFKA